MELRSSSPSSPSVSNRRNHLYAVARLSPEHIFAFTVELGTGLYMLDSIIGPETARNRSAILYLIGMADRPYRAIGKASAYCS